MLNHPFAASAACVSLLLAAAVPVSAVAAPGTVELVKASYAVGEANPQVSIVVRRAGGFEGPASVDIATQDDSAIAGEDYTAASATLSWAAGEGGTRTLVVPLLDDSSTEPNERLRVNLANATGAALGALVQATVVIISNDSRITLVRPSTWANESGAATVLVRRTGAARDAVSVGFAAVSGTAFPGDDFVATPGRVSWAAGESGDKPLVIGLVDDAKVELHESFSVRIADPQGAGAALGERVETVVQVADDDTDIEFSKALFRADEGAGTVQVAVRRIGNAAAPAQVHVATSDASARAGLDYTPALADLSWAAGETGAKTFTVSLLEDEAAEKTEVVALRLTDPVGANLGHIPSARVLIGDNDTCPLPPGPQVLHEWDGTSGAGVAGNEVTDPEQAELFALPKGCRASSLDVVVTWGLFAEDLDLTVIDPAGGAHDAANFQTSGEASETLSIASPITGVYAASVIGYLSPGTAYHGVAMAQIVAGGGGGGPDLGPVPDPVSDPARARVVVSVIDSGINPYHAYFYGGSDLYPTAHPSSVTKEVLQALGVKPENVVQLTRTGNIANDIASDAAFWSRVVPGEPYYFKGTNIIGVSYAAPADAVLRPDVAKSAHGVGTTSAVLKANPDAVILMVETASALGNDASHEYAFGHPAVDIVSTSYGISFNVPVVGNTGFPEPESRAFHFTYQSVVEQGKLHFSSGGNAPGLTPLRAGAGVWWSIGVSGIEEDTSEGRTALSGHFPDFISDFTQDLAYCMDCEAGLSSVGGTSFSTPRAAGVASKVLLETRRALHHAGGITTIGTTPVMAAGEGKAITNWFLRRALEQGAWLPDPLAYDPVEGVFDLAGLPINPLAPWVQTAWGDLTAVPAKGVVPAALAHLGLGGTPRAKSAGYCEFQTQVVLARKMYWDSIAPLLPDLSGSEGDLTGVTPAQDPFVYCRSQIPTHPASNDPPPPPAP